MDELVQPLTAERPRLVFQTWRSRQCWAPGSPQDEGGEGTEEPRASPLTSAQRKGRLCPGSTSRAECRRRAEATWELAKRWLSGQLVAGGLRCLMGAAGQV